MTAVRFLSATALAGAALVVPTLALAQAAPVAADARAAPANVSEDAIIVTGSRIPRANFDTPQPVSVLNGDQIELRGYTNLGEALQELPAFGVPGSSRAGGQSGDIGSGQTFVNFFGLGSQRTLTLVNGRRFVSSNTPSIFGPTGNGGSQVDFNVIPTKLVERIETVTVGGAPIYGSDAIAGTVNVILKKNYKGISIDGQIGISDRGDDANQRIRGIAGFDFAGGRGNFVVSGEYSRQEGLKETARAQTALQQFFTTPADPNSPYDNVLINNRRLPSLSKFGTPLVADFIPLSQAQATDFGFQPSVTDAQGRPLAFDAGGNLVPIDFGTPSGSLINASGGNGYNLGEVSNLDTPTERYLGSAFAHYEFSNKLRVFGEFWYSNTKGTQLAAQPVYNTALFDAAGTPDGNLIISVNNPYLSPAARATIVAALASNPASDALDTFYVGRANVDLASGIGSTTTDLFRVVGGFDGRFNIGSHEFTFEAVGNYGKAITNGSSRQLVQANFENALNAVQTANGIACAPGYTNSPIATVSSVCSPINPFGQQISQAAVDYVTTIARPRTVNTQKVGTINVVGDLIKLPAGEVKISLGYEHREESASFNPGTFYFGITNPDGTRSSYGRSTPIDPVDGHFNTDEVFGELRVPLVSPEMGIPAIHSLEFNGAIRYVDHSIAGSDPTYTAGAEWSPIRDITFRGNYTRSIRSPSITELFNPTSGSFSTANDPCDSRFLNSGPNPTVRKANCAAAGLAPDFQSNIVDFTSKSTVSGNRNLTSEKANSWTVGAIVRPRFLPGLTASVDWVSIKLNNAIVTLDATQTLNACYDATAYPNAFCNKFTRDANGQITIINTGYNNAASREYGGLIADVEWTRSTPFLGRESKLSLGVQYQYNDKLQQQVGTGDLTTFRGNIGYSKHKATGNLTYANRGFVGQVQVQYIGSAVVDPDAKPSAYDFYKIGAVAYVNSTMSYRVNERFSLNLNVDNLLDTGAPFAALALGDSLSTYFTGVIGRSYRVSATVDF